MLQSAPTTAPGSTCAQAQIRVPAPTSTDSHSPSGCTRTSAGGAAGSATACYRRPQQVRDPLLLLAGDTRVKRQRQDLRGGPLGHREVAALAEAAERAGQVHRR